MTKTNQALKELHQFTDEMNLPGDVIAKLELLVACANDKKFAKALQEKVYNEVEKEIL